MSRVSAHDNESYKVVGARTVVNILHWTEAMSEVHAHDYF